MRNPAITACHECQSRNERVTGHSKGVCPYSVEGVVPATVPQLMTEKDFLYSGLLSDYGTDHVLQEVYDANCEGLCRTVSEDFVEWLETKGVEAEMWDVDEGEHTVVLVEFADKTVVVDWTARQFSADAECPVVDDVESYSTEKVEDGEYDL